MVNRDLDDDVDLAMLWQDLHDRPDEPLAPNQKAWMEAHGISDQAGLDDYRDKKMVAFNIAAGFTLYEGKWRTQKEMDELTPQLELKL